MRLSTAEFIRLMVHGEHECRGSIEECEPHNPECMDCGARDCPHREPLHYHHDGCPACYRAELERCGEILAQELWP